MAEHKDDRVILCVGLVCIDIIAPIDGFLVEDSDQRVNGMSWQRGGNASNSCTVLRQLGVPCQFLGTIGVNDSLGFIKSSFESYDIAIDHCVYHKGSETPTSIVMINTHNGSRTIIHSNKTLPEVTFEDFQKVDLSSNKYKWIHFEGRPNCASNRKMLAHIDEHNQRLSDTSLRVTTSVELEKCRKDLDLLVDMADYVFISKDYARFKGFSTKEETVEGFATRCRPGSCIICPWGKEGAVARTPGGQLVASHSYPPVKVIDTCGAGDSFNAATIVALTQGKTIESAIKFGCKVAGAKIGMYGYTGLKGMFSGSLTSDLLVPSR